MPFLKGAKPLHSAGLAHVFKKSKSLLQKIPQIFSRGSSITKNDEIKQYDLINAS
jgi:hypothetical protein